MNTFAIFFNSTCAAAYTAWALYPGNEFFWVCAGAAVLHACFLAASLRDA